MEPLAYLNGQLVPGSQLTVAVTDAGFVQGVTIAEQLRTFKGRLFCLEEHLQRLRHSLTVVGLSDVDVDPLAASAESLAAHNHGLLAPDDDLGLCLFVTPGAYPAMVAADSDRPTVAMHTFPVPFRFWADKYASGQKLVVTSIRQVPGDCWPAELKCRSRMHYYLADQEARRIDPEARALLLDQTDSVMEASTANIVIYRRAEGFVSPPREKILPGLSAATLEQLSAKLGVSFSHRSLTVEDLQSADEVILSSTSPCLLPVSAIDGEPIGDGSPGPMFNKAIAAWSELVGIDIIEQARRFQSR